MSAWLDGKGAGCYNKPMLRTSSKSKRRLRRIRERSLGAALGWSLLVVMALGLLLFEADLHWPNTALNNLWNLLIVNGQVRPDSPLTAQYLGEINRQDLAFFSYACLFSGGIALGRLAPRTASRRRILLAAIGGTGGIVAVCLALAWSLQVWIQRGHLRPHQIDAILVGTQLGWAVSWVLVYIAGTLLGLRGRGPIAGAGRETDTARAAAEAATRS